MDTEYALDGLPGVDLGSAGKLIGVHAWNLHWFVLVYGEQLLDRNIFLFIYIYIYVYFTYF